MYTIISKIVNIPHQTYVLMDDAHLLTRLSRREDKVRARGGWASSIKHMWKYLGSVKEIAGNN